MWELLASLRETPFVPPSDTPLWSAGLDSGLGADLRGVGLAWTRVVTAARDDGEQHRCRQ